MQAFGGVLYQSLFDPGLQGIFHSHSATPEGDPSGCRTEARNLHQLWPAASNVHVCTYVLEAIDVTNRALSLSMGMRIDALGRVMHAPMTACIGFHSLSVLA